MIDIFAMPCTIILANNIMSCISYTIRGLMNNKYFTVKQISEKWGLKPRTVQIMCVDGKIPGTIKFGRDWAILEDAKRPADKRVVTGQYRDYRKNMERNRKKDTFCP